MKKQHLAHYLGYAICISHIFMRIYMIKFNTKEDVHEVTFKPTRYSTMKININLTHVEHLFILKSTVFYYTTINTKLKYVL